MKLINSVKSWFRNKYVALFQLVTFNLLFSTNLMMRKLILLKGLDPDYVAPPPLKGESYNWRNVFNSRQGPLGIPNWVREPKHHPVLKTRKIFEGQNIKTVVLDPPAVTLNSEELSNLALQVVRAESENKPKEKSED